MPQLKISQNPETGHLETSAQGDPTPQGMATAPAQINDRTLALANLGPQRDDSRQLGHDLPSPEKGEQLLALRGRSREVQDAEQTLRNHSLNGSFLGHFEQQLKQGKIRIGVIDDFSDKNGRNHGVNVEQRILSQMPQELRSKVEIVRYDVQGMNELGKARMIALAAHEAQGKQLLALSVSGGINAYEVPKIEKLIGGRDLTKDTASDAYKNLVKNNNTIPELQNAMKQLNLASGKIPVITPVWNNDSTTLPALLLGSRQGNGIITSVDGSNIATKIPGMVDVSVPGGFGNGYTSQSAPLFIGNMLRYGLEQYEQRYPRVPTPQPGPARPQPRRAEGEHAHETA
jgi:hypothetical protein